MTYTCKYCGKRYKTETGLKKHKCSVMERMETFDNNAYNIFLTMNLVYGIKNRDSDEDNKIAFAKSIYYKDLINLNKWYNGITEISIKDYFQFLKQFQIPIKKWINDNTFKKFILYYTTFENEMISSDRSDKYIKRFGENIYQLSFERLLQGITSGMITKQYIKKNNIDVFKLLTPEELSSVVDYLK